MTSAVATAKEHISPTSTFEGSPVSSPINRDTTGAIFIVVMGVSGTGKSTLGAALGRALRLPFVDGDDLHPPANVAKMSRGAPLEDRDRWPWLETIRGTAVGCVVDGPVSGEGTETGGSGPDSDGASLKGVIVACSSLKKTYRAVLRGETQPRGSTSGAEGVGLGLRTYFVYLKGDREVLMARMVRRQGHFMKAGMLESQLDTLESPEGEPGVVTVSVEMSTAEQVQRVVDALRTSTASSV